MYNLGLNIWFFYINDNPNVMVLPSYVVKLHQDVINEMLSVVLEQPIANGFLAHFEGIQLKG